MMDFKEKIMDLITTCEKSVIERKACWPRQKTTLSEPVCYRDAGTVQ